MRSLSDLEVVPVLNDNAVVAAKPTITTTTTTKQPNDFDGQSTYRDELVTPVEEVVNKLAPILNVKNEFLLSKFENKLIGIELLDEISENQAKKIKNHI